MCRVWVLTLEWRCRYWLFPLRREPVSHLASLLGQTALGHSRDGRRRAPAVRPLLPRLRDARCAKMLLVTLAKATPCTWRRGCRRTSGAPASSRRMDREREPPGERDHASGSRGTRTARGVALAPRRGGPGEPGVARPVDEWSTRGGRLTRNRSSPRRWAKWHRVPLTQRPRHSR